MYILNLLLHVPTRRVAVYLETHCNITRRKHFPPAYSTGDRNVYLFTDAQPV